MSHREGDKIVIKEHLSRSQQRNNKIVREAVKDYQLKVNFRYR